MAIALHATGNWFWLSLAVYTRHLEARNEALAVPYVTVFNTKCFISWSGESCQSILCKLQSVVSTSTCLYSFSMSDVKT